jgi:hypothetical protein
MLTANCGYFRELYVGDQYEPDNQCSSARPILLDAQQTHTLDNRYDKDWLTLRVEAGRRYQVRFGRNFANDSGLRIWLHESCTGVSTNSGPFVNHTATATGNVYLKVTGQKRNRYEIVATELR